MAVRKTRIALTTLALCALVATAGAGSAGASAGDTDGDDGTPTSGGSLTVAPTPPMGWNSWNSFGRDISDELIRRQADAMVASGLRDAGYDYLTIDGGWRAPDRDAAGNLVAHPQRFPNGMKAVADYVHSKGLKLGVHQPMGMTDCGRESPGTQSAPGGERQDAELFASWGVDYVKYDRCTFDVAPDTTPPAPDVDRISVRQGTTVVTTVEAEAPGNVLGGRAVISACAPMQGMPASRGTCSGQRVAGIGIDKGSLRFENVSVPADGTYQLDLQLVLPNYGQARGYLNTTYGRAQAQVQANDAAPVTTRVNFNAADVTAGFPSVTTAMNNGWDSTVTRTVSVPLHAGANSITISNDTSIEEALRQGALRMGDALRETGRPMLYSLSGQSRPWLWAQGVGQLWRTNGDIGNCWDCATGNGVLQSIDRQDPLAGAVGPGGFNDPDMLMVGVTAVLRDGYPIPGTTREMSLEEQRSHFSMWAVIAAPLITGLDLTTMSSATQAILTNQEVIAIDQDPLAAQGVRVRDDGDLEVWAKPLADGSRAVALLNRGPEAATIATTAAEAGLPSAAAYLLKDVWTHRLSVTKEPITATVPSHGVVLLRVTAKGVRG
ncbi:hypothetical protein GCM10027053_17190 [Intrasporangium mesophilum]